MFLLGDVVDIEEKTTEEKTGAKDRKLNKPAKSSASKTAFTKPLPNDLHIHLLGQKYYVQSHKIADPELRLHT